MCLKVVLKKIMYLARVMRKLFAKIQSKYYLEMGHMAFTLKCALGCVVFSFIPSRCVGVVGCESSSDRDLLTLELCFQALDCGIQVVYFGAMAHKEPRMLALRSIYAERLNLSALGDDLYSDVICGSFVRRGCLVVYDVADSNFDYKNLKGLASVLKVRGHSLLLVSNLNADVVSAGSLLSLGGVPLSFCILHDAGSESLSLMSWKDLGGCPTAVWC